VIMC